MERDFTVEFSITSLSNFNSHAHVERDIIECALKFYNDISTHTLTWSVTLGYYFGTEYKLNFNSHAHVERDDVFARNARHPIISTHTLTWSVTINLSSIYKS